MISRPPSSSRSASLFPFTSPCWPQRAERLPIVVHVRTLLHRALQLAVELSDLLLAGFLGGDVAVGDQNRVVLAVGQGHAPGVDQHDPLVADGCYLAAF